MSKAASRNSAIDQRARLNPQRDLPPAPPGLREAEDRVLGFLSEHRNDPDAFLDHSKLFAWSDALARHDRHLVEGGVSPGKRRMVPDAIYSGMRASAITIRALWRSRGDRAVPGDPSTEPDSYPSLLIQLRQREASTSERWHFWLSFWKHRAKEIRRAIKYERLRVDEREARAKYGDDWWKHQGESVITCPSEREEPSRHERMKLRIEYSDGVFRGGLMHAASINWLDWRSWRGRPRRDMSETLFETFPGFEWYLLRVAAHPKWIGSIKCDDLMDLNSFVLRILPREAATWLTSAGYEAPADLIQRSDETSYFEDIQLPNGSMCGRTEGNAGTIGPAPAALPAAGAASPEMNELIWSESDDGSFVLFGDGPSKGLGKVRVQTAAWALLTSLKSLASRKPCAVRDIAKAMDRQLASIPTDDRIARLTADNARVRPRSRKPSSAARGAPYEGRPVDSLIDELQAHLRKAWRANRSAGTAWRARWIRWDQARGLVAFGPAIAEIQRSN